MNLNNFKIGNRLTLGFGIVIALLLLLSANSWRQMTALDDGLDTAVAQANKMSMTKEIDSLTNTINLEIWSLVTANDPAAKQSHKAAIAKEREEFQRILGELKSSAKHQQDKDLLAALETAIASVEGLNQRVIDLAFQGDGQDAKALELFQVEGAKAMFEKIDPAIEALISYRQTRIQGVVNDANIAYRQACWTLIIGGVVALALVIFFGVIITRSIVIPIRDYVGFTGQLACGDFSKAVPETLRSRGDEMGDLARAFDAMTDNLRKLLHEINSGVETLAASATELSSVSGQTAVGVKSMSDKTATVAAAAEEASANTMSVAAGMEQAATNLSSVASATEEMSATVGEIAANSEKARNISEQATAQTESISSMMQQLGQSARDIGKVTETITEISSQTNLLALNATIEAARAGAAGKGFAVVANEIKELARQTAAATEDIKAKISGVQTSAGSAIADIDKIASVIKEVGSIVSNIAAAIDEQAKVTKDVAGNIAQATAGVKDSNERVAQTATVSKSIAQDVAGISAAVSDIRSGGEQVEASAAELSQLSDNLRQLVSRFRTNDTGAGAANTARSHSHSNGADSSSSAASVDRMSAPPAERAHRPFIEWSESYSVGVPAMDQHHKKLFDLINSLHAAMRTGQSRTALGATLEELANYVNYHFAAEEKLMKQHKCSGLADQIAAHTDLVEKVTALRQQFASGQQGLGVEVLNMLRDWLVNHIQRKDKACMSVLCEMARARATTH